MKQKMTRRQFVKTAAVTTVAIAGAPYVQTAHSAGKLKLFFWSHWVPGALDASKLIVEEWGKKNGLEITIDAVTGSQMPAVAVGESRARSGHDMMALRTWYGSILRDDLVTLDDVVKDVTRASGPFIDASEYVCKHDGRWVAVPSPIGSHTYPMVMRADYFKKYAGVDVKKIFPASPQRDKMLTDAWTWQNFEGYARKIHQGGHSFGAPIAQQTDSGNWISPVFHSYGSVLVDAKGNITVNSDNTREVLEFLRKLTESMPPDVYAWDNAGNNRWLISGKGGAIVNPPSAWAVAKRIYLKDKSKDGVTHVWHADQPRGPKGHYRAYFPFLYGIWKFSKQQNACKDLMRYMLSRDINFKLITAGQGYDIPSLPSYWDHPVWTTIGPPIGGQYNYPVRGSEELMVTGFPAPPPIAAQIQVQAIHSVMTAKVSQAKEPVDQVIKWAESELEGFMRG